MYVICPLVPLPPPIVILLAVNRPAFVTLNLLLPPTCKSISNDEALDAVSVTFNLIAVGVPVVFHVPARSTRLCALLPERLYDDAVSAEVFALGVNCTVRVPTIVLLDTENNVAAEEFVIVSPGLLVAGVTLNTEEPPTCRSHKMLLAPEAVFVTFSNALVKLTAALFQV